MVNFGGREAFKIFTVSPVCMVLLHLTRICRTGAAKKISPLASCSHSEKEAIL